MARDVDAVNYIEYFTLTQQKIQDVFHEVRDSFLFSHFEIYLESG